MKKSFRPLSIRLLFFTLLFLIQISAPVLVSAGSCDGEGSAGPSSYGGPKVTAEMVSSQAPYSRVQSALAEVNRASLALKKDHLNSEYRDQYNLALRELDTAKSELNRSMDAEGVSRSEVTRVQQMLVMNVDNSIHLENNVARSFSRSSTTVIGSARDLRGKPTGSEFLTDERATQLRNQYPSTTSRPNESGEVSNLGSATTVRAFLSDSPSSVIESTLRPSDGRRASVASADEKPIADTSPTPVFSNGDSYVRSDFSDDGTSANRESVSNTAGSYSPPGVLLESKSPFGVQDKNPRTYEKEEIAQLSKPGSTRRLPREIAIDSKLTKKLSQTYHNAGRSIVSRVEASATLPRALFAMLALLLPAGLGVLFFRKKPKHSDQEFREAVLAASVATAKPNRTIVEIDNVGDLFIERNPATDRWIAVRIKPGGKEKIMLSELMVGSVVCGRRITGFPAEQNYLLSNDQNWVATLEHENIMYDEQTAPFMRVG